MVYMFLADGFETVEALCPLDLMRRAGIEIKTVGITGKVVTSSHNIKVEADILPDDMEDSFEMLIFPGGLGGAERLDESEVVDSYLKKAIQLNSFICAICAAPMILGKRGYLKGKKATCFPGFEVYLDGAECVNSGVVTDGKFITGRAMGSSTEFGLELVAALKGKEISDEIKSKVHFGE